MPYEIGVSPLGPSRAVKAAIRKSVRDINCRPRDAQERLERLLFSRFGIGSANLLLAGSLKELVYAITQALRPGNLLIVGPAIDLYRDAAVFAGSHVEFLQGKEETEYLPDIPALEEKIGSYDMVFMANPNRVTGKAIEEATIMAMVERLSERGCIVVIDEALIEFTRQKSFIEHVPARGNIIVLRTTACYYGLAGLELAFASANEAVIAAMRKSIHGELNLLALVAARTAMKDKSFGRLTEKFMEDEKRLLLRAFRGMEGVGLYGSDTNVLLFKKHVCLPAVARIAEKACLAAELYAGPAGADLPLLRISLMRHEHNLRLIKIMKQVCAPERGT